MEFSQEELQELEQLIEEYRDCPQDGSYWKHIENFFTHKAREVGLLPED